jgi:hypothetical protein
MGLFFIWLTLSIATIIVAWKLQDIVIELRYKNSLVENQNEILKELVRKIK